MEIKEIKELIDYCENKDYLYFKIETNNNKLIFIKPGYDPKMFESEVGNVINETVIPMTSIEGDKEEKPVMEVIKEELDKNSDLKNNDVKNKIIQIKSSYIGVVTISEKIKNGSMKVKAKDVLCSIEAMKIYNEVLSPVSGVIKEIYVEDNDIIEFNQIIFDIEVEDNE